MKTALEILAMMLLLVFLGVMVAMVLTMEWFIPDEEWQCGR